MIVRPTLNALRTIVLMAFAVMVLVAVHVKAVLKITRVLMTVCADLFWQAMTPVMIVQLKVFLRVAKMGIAMAAADAKHILIQLSVAQRFVLVVIREMHHCVRVVTVWFPLLMIVNSMHAGQQSA